MSYSLSSITSYIYSWFGYSDQPEQNVEIMPPTTAEVPPSPIPETRKKVPFDIYSLLADQVKSGQSFNNNGCREFLLLTPDQQSQLYKVASTCNNLFLTTDDYSVLSLHIRACQQPDDAFYQKFHALTSEQQQHLYDLAFECNNHFIHEPADVSIAPQDYSINLLWVNKTRIPDEQKYLFGKGSTVEEQEADFHAKFVTPISSWAKKNPGTAINVWIDSEMATPQALENSMNAIHAALEGAEHGAVRFRDIRTLDVVAQHPKVFSEDTPVYFRVDLVKGAAADQILRDRECLFAVVVDLDGVPMSERELFEKRTQTSLTDLGFVMAKGGILGFENGFQILNGQNQNLMQAHREVIIDMNISLVYANLETDCHKKVSDGVVYDTYPAMLTRFLELDGRYGPVKKERVNPQVDWDEIEGIERYRYDYFYSGANSYLPFGEKKSLPLKSVMPMKPAGLPPSHFNY